MRHGGEYTVHRNQGIKCCLRSAYNICRPNISEYTCTVYILQTAVLRNRADGGRNILKFFFCSYDKNE